jgi:hypothetical protein
MSLGAWNGFQQGFYPAGTFQIERLLADALPNPYDCLAYDSQAFTSLERVLNLTDSLSKDTFFLTGVSIIRNLVTVVVDLRNTCRITDLIVDVSDFCREECEGKRIIGRLTKNLTTLSRLSQEILNTLYDWKRTEGVVEEVRQVQALGRKAGEFLRIAIGFNTIGLKPRY